MQRTARPRAARAPGAPASVGPGSSVRMWIDLVTDTALSVAERRGDTLAQVDAADLDHDPLAQLEAWLAEARAAGIVNAEAMALATASPDGAPSVRMVLLKGHDRRRIAFFTNLESRKAERAGGQPARRGALYWQPLDRQVRLEGAVQPLPQERRRGVLRHAAARQPDRRVGLAAITASSPTAPSSSASTPRSSERFDGSRRSAAAAALGRLPARPGGLRVLAEPAEPPARPHPLRARRRRLASLPARAVEALASGATVRVPARLSCSCPAAFQSRKPLAPWSRTASIWSRTCARS